MRVRSSDQDSIDDNSDKESQDELEYHEDSVSDSAVLINTGKKVPEYSDVESEELLYPESADDNNAEILKQGLSQIMNPYNPYLSENLHDPQSYEYDYKSRTSETLTEESQVTSDFVNPTPISFDEINLFSNTVSNTVSNCTDTDAEPAEPEIQNKSKSSQNSNNNIPKKVKENLRKDTKKTDPKGNFRKVIKNYKNNSNLDSNDFGKDLAGHIPGLHRLLDLYKSDSPSSPADRVIISRDSLKKFCNDIVPSSFKSVSDIDYTQLNSISFRLIGCYGNHSLIAKFLLKKEIIDQQIYDLLIGSENSENKNEPFLRPGIYLLVVDPDLALVIHWSEPGCYEGGASPQQKNNMIYLHRCLTKLTDCQLCLMSDKDLDRFDWNLNNSKLDNEDESCYEFEVKKSQEEDDGFAVDVGFKVNLPDQIKADINNPIQDNVPLYPIVVESTTHQSFITRKMAKKLDKRTLSYSSTFKTDLCNLLKNRSLCINRESMNMKQLEALIDNGLKSESKFLKPFYDEIDAAKSRRETKINQAKKEMGKDAEIIIRMGWKQSYSIFETFANNENSETFEEEAINEDDINDINSRYPEVKDLIKGIKINSPAWIKLKQRYGLSHLVIKIVYKLLEKHGKFSEEVIEQAIQEMYEMFVDKETDTHKLVSKYEKRAQDFFSSRSGASDIKFDKQRIAQTDEQARRFSETKLDSKFMQDLAGPFFGKKVTRYNQMVIEAFLNEYKNWKKDNFPNTVKEMVTKFFYNQQRTEKIDEEFSQEKKDIANREFEKICNQLEEKYRKGTLRVNILNFIDETDEDNDNQSPCLTYEFETDQLQITIYETVFDESDISKIQDDEFHISNPTLSSNSSNSVGQYGHYFQIDPLTYDFSKISQFDNCKFLLVLHNKKLQRIEIFFEIANKLVRKFKKSDSIKPFKTLESDGNFLVTINEPKGLIAIFDTKKAELSVLSFSDDKSSLYARNKTIELLEWYNDTPPSIEHFLFIKNTEEICFVETGGKARIFNLINQRFRPAVCRFPSNATKVLSTPDGTCIVAFVKERVDKTISDQGYDSVEEKIVCNAYVYFCKHFGGSDKTVVELPSAIQYLGFLQFTCINKLQNHLMTFDIENGCFNSAIVKVTLERSQFHFQERTQKQSLGWVKLTDSFYKDANYTTIKGKNTQFEKSIQNGQNIIIMSEKYNVIKVISDTKLIVAGNLGSTSGLDKWMEYQIEPIESRTKLNGLIDVYRLMYERYPVENCIDSDQSHPISLKIVLDIENNDVEGYGEKFEYYVYENLRYSTKKLATILKKFSASVNTFQELYIENVKFLKKYSADFSPEYKLGDWMMKLCCIIPVQIAMTKNNLFQPLNDEMSWNEADRVEFDNGYGHHVDSIAKNISFGWYEGIFKQFGDKKVKVISSVGEQSCEKLNHLIGTSFDESAMNCAEGVWMSLVNTKKCIYVALNFGCFKFQERSPQEDLLFTLFNTVASNLILFRNPSTLKKDVLLMVKRFQDGAALFDTGAKTLQAKLCIIINDVSRTNKEGIIGEFKSNISQLVLEEGDDNFISRMYRGGVDIISWPKFNDAEWLENLSNISKKLIRQEAKHENTRAFLQTIKIIMAKLKICDWNSLEETLMQIRVATLKRLLPTVVSYGLEQRDINDSVTQKLMNRDTGELIDDPAVALSDFLDDVEISTEILPDSDINLCEEKSSFKRCSEELRSYFEGIMQSREASSDDNKWFANFGKFLKFIVERRAKRAWEWYAQNTAKFPQDHSDIINGKYALEKEISKLTLLWTLCGSVCHRCGLKCVKSCDHEEDHDCFTDHKCHVVCDFIDDHSDSLIPKCSFSAGHEGKHACNKMKHMCIKKCTLFGKRNCQKVCSKEVGHSGKHSCASTRHYCEENCSLSAYTPRGDYRCPNKCIISYDEPHATHRCENTTCPIQCPVGNCPRKCQSNDHHHAYADLEVDHFCGHEHPCQEHCQEDGICKIVTVPKRQLTFTKYTQLKERLRCSKKIPPNQFEHIGKHTHKEDGFHYCDEKCQFCEYFCTLPYGHIQNHDTKHGNMIKNDFTDETGDNELSNKSKDKGPFVLCNLHCKDLGRHRHIDYCKSEENCKLGNQSHDIKHIDEQMHPNPDKPKDFISHKLFWQRTGFRDPYSVKEQVEFTKCYHTCPDEKHQGLTNEASYCELPLFHAPLDPNNLDSVPIHGYVSSEGHHFNCEKPEDST